ncbi:unnamed protein product [Camellia sinensis]
MAETLITPNSHPDESSDPPAPPSIESLFSRKVDFHPAKKPFSGFSNGSGGFRLETLNPTTISDPRRLGASGQGSGQSGLAGKKPDGSEFLDVWLDPELSLEITFRRIGAGLENLGNTCFLNSVIQCLTYAEPLAAYLQSGKHQNSYHATLQNPWSTCGNHNLSPPLKSLQAVHKENTSDTLEETDEITSDTSEEAQILADLLEANGVNKLFDKLEAPFAPSNLLLGTFSNEAATHIQKGLTISLQSMTDVNGMIAVANNVFMILKSLGVDFISFYEKVKIFLGCFALKTQLADSSNLSTAEFEAQYYENKLHFDKVSGEHEQLSASIIKSDEHIAGLNQRIIQTKELLKQLEEELSSTQVEHASFMCDFAQASESVSKSEKDVQTALNVLIQHKKKNGQHSVVERAFDGDLKYTLYGVLVHAGWSTHSGHYYCLFAHQVACGTPSMIIRVKRESGGKYIERWRERKTVALLA